ncbi:hypothetical protein [Rhizobium rhizogenes]|uniref:hypothetical protein n=1 Tax=Rhizobium rhizogenes TaxID=359 RepID=UPI001572F388|nr:hypothetical protein [Rhizobium rhizogenes]NTI27132.1 hypothetical protein [Rhizobium rhizogenes]
MQLQPSTENAGNASVADAKKLYDLADEMVIAAGNLVCMCDLMENGIDDALFPGLDVQHTIEELAGENCTYVSAKERRLLGFMANDCAVRAKSLDAMAEQVVEAAKALHKLLKVAQLQGGAA